MTQRWMGFKHPTERRKKTPIISLEAHKIVSEADPP